MREMRIRPRSACRSQTCRCLRLYVSMTHWNQGFIWRVFALHCIEVQALTVSFKPPKHSGTQAMIQQPTTTRAKLQLQQAWISMTAPESATHILRKEVLHGAPQAEEATELQTYCCALTWKAKRMRRSRAW